LDELPFPDASYDEGLDETRDWPEAGLECAAYVIPRGEGDHEQGVRQSGLTGAKKKVIQSRGEHVRKGDFIAFPVTDPKAAFYIGKVVKIRQYSVYIHFLGCLHTV
jgi:hypothetical protein